MIDRIRTHVKGSSEVLDNLFQWARIELDERQLNPTQVDVALLIHRLYEQNASHLQEKSISFTPKIEENLRVAMDENQLEIILRNIITNAIKFTHEDGVINITAYSESGKSIIKINDNGVGMSEENINRLFLPNHHFTTLGTSNEKGTGIGLLISYEMMKKNQGDILVESKIGEGTTFCLVFRGL